MQNDRRECYAAPALLTVLHRYMAVLLDFLALFPYQLQKHMERAAELFQREGETELLRWLAKEFVHEKSELELLMKAVAGDAAAVSMLMDISKRRFSIGKKKGFSL